MANKEIATIGLWHLGSVYSASLAKLGFNVSCFDFDEVKINNFKKGISPIFEPNLEEYLEKYKDKLVFSTSIETLKNKDYIFITHDTEVDENDTVQMEIFNQIFQVVSEVALSSTTVVISSQVPVGTARILVDALKKKGIKNPRVICFPENLRLGSAFDSFLKPDRIILGSDNNDALRDFKEDFDFNCPILTMGLESAEMVKHALNCYLATCISFSSELTDISEKINVNMMDVVKALKLDKRVSPNAPLNPGLGFAGGTLGRDVQTIKKIASDHNYEPILFDAVYNVNKQRIPYLTSKIGSFFKDLKDKRIGILGLTYKPNTDTLRRSMSLDLAKNLHLLGCKVRALDPRIKNTIIEASFIEVAENESIFFKNLDMVVLMTDCKEFLDIDIDVVSKLMKDKILIDTKNFLDIEKYKNAGFTYVGIGIN